MKKSSQTILLLLIAFGTSKLAVGQTLNRIRNEVREPSKPASSKPERPRKKNKSNRSSFDDNYDDDEPNAFEKMAGKVLLAGLSAPFLVPRAALSDSGGPGYYPDYPYDGHSHALTFDSQPAGVHSSLIVLQADYGTDFDALSHAHGRIFGDLARRLGFDSEFYYRREELAAGDDDLWNGDFNVTWRFAQNERWQFRAGLGINWLSDRFGSDAGFNSTYAVEWFPADPVMVSSSLDWGRVGDSSLLHSRNTIGWTHNGWGLFTGYDYLRIGDAKTHAWINGLEYRF